MTMKKQAVAAVLAAMMTLGGAFSVSAAGVGIVNLDATVQSHPKWEKAQLDMNEIEQKAEAQFEKDIDGKSDQEKQTIAQATRKDVSDKENAIMQPILKDVYGAIEKVRKEKGLDVVLKEAAVADGGVDITTDVQNVLKQ